MMYSYMKQANDVGKGEFRHTTTNIVHFNKVVTQVIVRSLD